METLTITINEASKALGVSDDTVRRLLEDCELKGFRCGRGKKRGRILIRRTELEAFISKREAVGV